MAVRKSCFVIAECGRVLSRFAMLMAGKVEVWLVLKKSTRAGVSIVVGLRARYNSFLIRITNSIGVWRL